MRKQIIAFGPARYYNRARYYSPQLGRFLSADPIGYGDGLNMYAYARNNPLNFRDPSGLSITDDIMDEVVATGSRTAKEETEAAALEAAHDIQKDEIDDIKDNVRESALAASLTGYRDSTKVISYRYPNSVIRPLTTWETIQFNYFSDLNNCLHGYCPPTVRQELFFDAVSFAIPFEKGAALVGITLRKFVLSDFIRKGPTVVSNQLINGYGAKGASVVWAIKGGGKDFWFHYHIHKYNWYKPWLWFKNTPIIK